MRGMPNASEAVHRLAELAGDQRFENWKLLRAFLWPNFLRSTIRASRVRKPGVSEGRLEVGPKLLEGSGQAEQDGAGLAELAAALDVDEHVDPARPCRSGPAAT